MIKILNGLLIILWNRKLYWIYYSFIEFEVDIFVILKKYNSNSNNVVGFFKLNREGIEIIKLESEEVGGNDEVISLFDINN